MYGGVRGRLINQGLVSYSINVQNECVASIVRYGISRDGGYSPTSKKHHGLHQCPACRRVRLVFFQCAKEKCDFAITN